MKLNKNKVEQALKQVIFPDSKNNIISMRAVKNIQIFKNEIEIDIEINNPTLQYKNNIEINCVKAIQQSVDEKVSVKINFIIKILDKSNQIKGQSIPGVKNIIAIASGKGGVGKSTVSANLSVSLSELGYNVGLIDADIYGPSMPIMFDLEGAKPEGITVEGKTKIKPIKKYGVKLLSIGFFVRDKALVWRGPMASKALNQLIWDAEWGELDYLIIDLPPGTGDIHLSLVQSLPLTGAIIVSTPQPIALADARKAINMFCLDSINVPVLGIIENMSYFVPEDMKDKKYFIFGKNGASKLAKEMKVNFLSELPIAQVIREAGDKGKPVVLKNSNIYKDSFILLSQRIIKLINQRNIEETPTKAVQITHSKGCSPK